MKLVSVAQMRTIEKEADAGGLSYAQMMENAGRGLAEIVLDLPFVEEAESRNIEALALVGPGNNGGDALVALDYLARQGIKTKAYLVKRKVQDDELVSRVLAAGGEALSADNDANFAALQYWLSRADILLDGVLGTGAKPPLKQEVADVLAKVLAAIMQLENPPFVVAVDCPSGVDCDTGEAADATIPADLTVTMAAVKQGLLKLPAFELVGELKVVDIGLAADLPALRELTIDVAEDDLVAATLPARPLDAHKGTFGAALICAGSVNYTGAALLSGKAAYRVGAGLVTMAVPEPLHAALAGQFPEATWLPLPHKGGFISESAADVFKKNLNRATALLIGPGFGLESSTGKFIEEIIPAIKIPVIFDADGLKLLSQIKDWRRKIPVPAVLTPHPGEMSVMTGLSKDEIQKDRQGIAAKFAKEWGHVLVLKGAFTIVASPDGRMTVVPVASPTLARAGTGDVLAGLIVGLCAQGVGAYESAVAGAWIHARAGLEAGSRLGGSVSVLAGDVLGAVPSVLAELGAG
jgi:NAD(P)H-hydrate epimerase